MNPFCGFIPDLRSTAGAKVLDCSHYSDLSHAPGMEAISRWLSDAGAIPPDLRREDPSHKRWHQSLCRGSTCSIKWLSRWHPFRMRAFYPMTPGGIALAQPPANRFDAFCIKNDVEPVPPLDRRKTSAASRISESHSANFFKREGRKPVLTGFETTTHINPFCGYIPKLRSPLFVKCCITPFYIMP